MYFTRKISPLVAFVLMHKNIPAVLKYPPILCFIDWFEQETFSRCSVPSFTIS